MRDNLLVPSHLARSSTEIGSSLGGSSWTATLGAKRLDSPSCSVIVIVGGEVEGEKQYWGLAGFAEVGT